MTLPGIEHRPHEYELDVLTPRPPGASLGLRKILGSTAVERLKTRIVFICILKYLTMQLINFFTLYREISWSLF